jgi:uncharacterized membrane protein HdeD (DUF308 family)
VAESDMGARRGGVATHGLTELDESAADHWWFFLVTGSLWLIFALVVFRFNIHSVTAVGWAVGGVCWAAGLNEFFLLGATRGGWKAVRLVLGVLFVLVGAFALVYPHRTFAEVAAIFSFFLLFKGMLDIAIAIMTRAAVDLWWVGLIVGTAEILLAFWAAGNFGREAVLLVVWVGAAALARGLMEITVAFRLRTIRERPGPMAPA